MSTRATVGRLNLDGSYDVIYTHNDGYPGHHWSLLTENYNTDEKVDALIQLGDLSVLGKEIGEAHDFHNDLDEHATWCLAYGRDRHEKDVNSIHLAGERELKEYLNDSWTEYIYIWRVVEQKWYWSGNYRSVEQLPYSNTFSAE